MRYENRKATENMKNAIAVTEYYARRRRAVASALLDGLDEPELPPDTFMDFFNGVLFGLFVGVCFALAFLP